MKVITPFTHSSLYENALTATIAEAIWLLQAKVNLIEHSWEDDNYNVSDTGGTLGTITFDKEDVVGVFFSADGTLNPFRKKSPGAFDYTDILENIPGELVKLAERECLQYMLQDYNGKTQPVITAAIWSQNQIIYTNNTLDLALQNGLFLIENYTTNGNEALAYWNRYYKLQEKEYAIVKKIVSLKRKASHTKLTLDNEMGSIIKAISKSEERLNLSKTILNSINIFY